MTIVIIWLMIQLAILLPQITPKNSYGMILEYFLVKDRFDYFFAAHVLLLMAAHFYHGNAAAVQGVALVIFLLFAGIGGWAPYYRYNVLLLQLVFTFVYFFAAGSAFYISIIIHVLSVLVMSTVADNIDTRYLRWIEMSVSQYERKYSHILPKNKYKKTIMLSLMFIEDKSRPKVVRVLENIMGKTIYKNRLMSYGILQTQHKTPVTDEVSIELAKQKLTQGFKYFAQELHEPHHRKLAVFWNGNVDYSILLTYVYNVILN